MKTITLPGVPLPAPVVMLGLMRIAEKSDAEIRDLVNAARESGIDFLDHADIYGGDWHRSEARFADALRLTPSQRAEFTIQTKCGIVPRMPTYQDTYYDFSYEHVVSQVEGSLRALRTDYLDILLLHRPDALAEPDEVARAFDDLERSGKVRAFGVSNHTPGQIALLKTAVRQPLIVNQLQLSLTHAPLVTHGMASNIATLDQSVSRDVGTLDYCRLNGITIQAWSPFQIGDGSGVFLGSPAYPELNALIDSLAASYQVPPLAIATAWLTRHPAQFQVVLGTTNPARVRQAALGSDLPLTRPEWYALLRAAGHRVP